MLSHLASEALQYGGITFRTASVFLRRYVPIRVTGEVHDRASLATGLGATMALIARLPRQPVTLSDGPAGRRIRAHFAHRLWGIPHTRLAQGVLILPDDPDEYLRGRHRQAVRTNTRRAREAGVTCRALDGVRARKEAAHILRARMPTPPEHAFDQPGDRWLVACAPDGEPLALAVVTVDAQWALLQSLASSDRDARTLLHTHLVGQLIAAGVGRLAVNGPAAPMLDPHIQYWQRLLGYRVCNLASPYRRQCVAGAAQRGGSTRVAGVLRRRRRRVDRVRVPLDRY